MQAATLGFIQVSHFNAQAIIQYRPAAISLSLIGWQLFNGRRQGFVLALT